jgi:mycothiol synthase
VLSGWQEGHVGSVGTHPAFRYMGLARALLLVGLGLLKQRSLETACTSTGSWNLAMQRAAGSVGFQTEGRTLFFARSVDVASDSGSQG